MHSHANFPSQRRVSLTHGIGFERYKSLKQVGNEALPLSRFNAARQPTQTSVEAAFSKLKKGRGPGVASRVCTQQGRSYGTGCKLKQRTELRLNQAHGTVLQFKARTSGRASQSCLAQLFEGDGL